MLRFYCVLLFVCSYLNGHAQGLKPEDKLPDVHLTNIYNSPQKSSKLSEMQSELTIVDFWSISCGSCVESFSKLASLQDKFKGRLKILMVNGSIYDDVQKVSAFLKRRKARTGLEFKLTYLLQDSILTSYFPYKTIPHCVWLDKDRKVIAITEGYELTEGNIRAVLEKKNAFVLDYKNDSLRAGVDIEPLQSEGFAEILQASWLTSEQKGRGSTITYEYGEQGAVKKMRILNRPLLSLYRICYPVIFKYGPTRLFIDEEAQYFFQDGPEEKRYCYQFQSPGISKAALREQMKGNLERYFNIKAVSEDRKIECYILKPGRNITRLRTKGGESSSDTNEESIHKYIRNESPARLCDILQSILKVPVIDEMDLSCSIDMEFPRDIRKYNCLQLKRYLKTQGILMETETKVLSVTRLKMINSVQLNTSH